MAQFENYIRLFSQLPGWFEKPAIALWDALLSWQDTNEVKGHLLEIGVWKGKSAALLALHAKKFESCVLVDNHPLVDAQAALDAGIPDARILYIHKQSQFLIRQQFISARARSFRWIHIDGEHSCQAVSADLEIANTLLGDRGVVVLDDFFSPAYPQVTQAVFQFLMSFPNRLFLFLCGFNKAYLCRPKSARTYLEFIKHSLVGEMKSRGLDITLWKTTEPADMNVFGITERSDCAYRGPDWAPGDIHL